MNLLFWRRKQPVPKVGQVWTPKRGQAFSGCACEIEEIRTMGESTWVLWHGRPSGIFREWESLPHFLHYFRPCRPGKDWWP